MPTISQQNRAAKDQFELVLRLRQSRNGAPGEDTAVLRLRANALIKDTLMSRLDIEVEVGEQEYVHTQGFTDLGKALAAGRALQLAFEGFRSAVPSGRANVSVVLDSVGPEETQIVHGGPSVEQKDLLDAAKPSQVLITQAFYKRLAHSQPVALRSFPPRAGVYEFLWTSEERLNQLQAEAEFMPTLVSEAAQTAATLNTVIEHPAAPASEPRPRYHPGYFERPPAFQRLSVLVHQAWAKVQSRQRMITISTAAAILIVICYLVISHAFLGRRPKEVRSSSPAVPPVLVAGPPGTANGSPKTGPAPGPTNPPVGPKPSLEPTPPTKTLPTGPRGKHPPVTPPVLKPGSRVRECTIAGSIPNYLDLAETNRGKGEYETAIQEYKEVLGCDPNNREAREGLQRTQKAEQLNGFR